MKRFLVAVVALLVLAAFVAGYWPEHQQRVAFEAEVVTLRAQLAENEALVRAGRLFGQLLTVTDAVTAMNYGQAQARVTTFFDEVRAESARTPVEGLRTTLEAMLRRRDAVTSALARAEPAVVDTLRELQSQLRKALGYSLPPVEEPPAAPPPAL